MFCLRALLLVVCIWIWNQGRVKGFQRYQHLPHQFAIKRFTIPKIMGPIMALSKDFIDEFARVERELELMKDVDEDDEAKKELLVILKCRDAINQIDQDLELFSEHINGNDEKLKETSLVFQREFSECRVQLISQLEKIFARKT